MSGGIEIVSPNDSQQKGSNFSHMIHRVAEVYKYPKSGEQIAGPQFYTEAASEGSSGLGTPSRDGEDSEANSLKLQQSPVSDCSVVDVRVQVMEILISNIFATVSALKNAYIKLQAAHSPYDAEKLQAADRAVINELRKLSELKHSYWERHAAPGGGQSQEFPAQSDMQSRDTVRKSCEGVISRFHSEIQQKNSELEKLKEILAQTISKKEKLERQVKKLEQRLARDLSVDISNEISLSPRLFESRVHDASEAARIFTKLLITLMKGANWDLDAASNSIESGISYSRRSHKKYAFESYVCHRMLNGFENGDFYINGSLSSVLDPEEHRRECFNQFQNMKDTDPREMVGVQCLFGKFCHKKFLELIHPKMEESFFGNLGHRNEVGNGGHPHTQFYDSFLRLAKAMWLVHRLAFAFDPTASIFQVPRGTDFSQVYMESIVHSWDKKDSSLAVPQKVGFTVMPGFRVEKSIIKCRVYLMSMNVAE